jgi:hypothetical protein
MSNTIRIWLYLSRGKSFPWGISMFLEKHEHSLKTWLQFTQGIILKWKSFRMKTSMVKIFEIVISTKVQPPCHTIKY